MFLISKGAAVVERLGAACSVLNGVLLQTCCNMSVLKIVLCFVTTFT
jgi:hypothetical protein